MSSINVLLSGEYENFLDFSRLTDEIHRRQLEKLKKHPETKKISLKNIEYNCGKVIEYVAKETEYEEVKKVSIYSTTNKSINSLDKFVKKEVKKELSKKNKFDKKLCLALQSQISSFIHARGFFSTISKEVYIVRDTHLIGEKLDRNMKIIKKALSKKKSDSRVEEKSNNFSGWKKTYGYKPPRFGHREWLAINFRSTLAHELFHYYMDAKCHTQNMMLQEEYAYKNMIGWMRKEGLKDEEIILSHLMWYGSTVAVGKDESLVLPGRKKEFKKVAKEEAQKLIDCYDASCRIKEKILLTPVVDSSHISMIEI